MHNLEKLSNGSVCFDCLHSKKCKDCFGNDDNNNYCQFKESRFITSPDVIIPKYVEGFEKSYALIEKRIKSEYMEFLKDNPVYDYGLINMVRAELCFDYVSDMKYLKNNYSIKHLNYLIDKYESALVNKTRIFKDNRYDPDDDNRMEYHRFKLLKIDMQMLEMVVCNLEFLKDKHNWLLETK